MQILEHVSAEDEAGVSEHIAPAPRVSVQAFCETVETAAAVQAGLWLRLGHRMLGGSVPWGQTEAAGAAVGGVFPRAGQASDDGGTAADRERDGGGDERSRQVHASSSGGSTAAASPKMNSTPCGTLVPCAAWPWRR